MPVCGARCNFITKRVWWLFFSLVAVIAISFSPWSIQSSTAMAGGGPSVVTWPSGFQSGVPSVVGVVTRSDAALANGTLSIDNGAVLSGCTVNKTDYYCNVSGIKWGQTYDVSGSVTDSSGTSPVSWSFQPVQNTGQIINQDLSIDSVVALWSSYQDYLERHLTVTNTLHNVSTFELDNVAITGSSASSGVTLGTPLPLTIGNMAAGTTATFSLQFMVPSNLTVFREWINASTSNSSGKLPVQTLTANKKIGFSVGDNFADLSDQDLENAMSDMASLGVGWLRFDMAWSALQPDGPGSFDWPRFDRIVAAASRHNIQLIPLLTYTPAWARPGNCTASIKCEPADPSQFATYAAAAAAHYAPMGIHTWEIWNEPNITQFWQPAPDPVAYTNVLKQSYASIKQVDPQATVVSAGLSDPTAGTGNIDPRDFLTSMYQNGAKDYMDAVGYHPYSFPYLPSGPSWTGWYVMSDATPSIRSIMVSYGDSNKQIWATEFGCPTNGPTWRGDELLQAVMVEDAMQQMSNEPWVAGLFLHTYPDLGTDTSTIENFFGVIRYDGSDKPAYYELKDVLSGLS